MWVGLLAVCCGGCGADFANLTASLGGSRAGARGSVRAVFINNTPHRAAFTFGTYDQTDPDFIPDAAQFGLEEVMLAGDEASDIGTLECARVFSVGGRRLLALIERNIEDAEVEQAAFVEGVAFYESQGESPDLVGMAPPFEALLGVDFPCAALLIVRLEVDDQGPAPFRVDFELIPSGSTR